MITKIKVEQFPEGSAERCMAEWLKCWQEEDWSKMVGYSQRRWCNNQKKENPDVMLVKSFSFARVLNLCFIDDITEGLNPKVIKKVLACFEIKSEGVKGKKKTKKVRIPAMVIKENEEGSPDENGKWGVNPISCFRMDGEEIKS